MALTRKQLPVLCAVQFAENDIFAGDVQKTGLPTG